MLCETCHPIVSNVILQAHLPFCDVVVQCPRAVPLEPVRDLF